MVDFEKRLKDKYVFVDFDGTLCEYRYNDHISGNTVDPNGKRLGGQSMAERLFDEVYYRARPLMSIKKVLDTLDPNKVFILGGFVTYSEIKQKLRWLKKYYPYIKDENMYFVADMGLKLDTLKEFSKHYNVPFSQMVFVDDKHVNLYEMEEAGVETYHITSFME